MFKDYFTDFNKKIRKKTAAKSVSTKGVDAKGGGIKASAKNTAGQIDIKVFLEKINNIIPSYLRIDSLKPVDSSGFSPDGVDLIVYQEYCRDIKQLMNGYIPYELIHGAFFIMKDLNKNSLADTFGKVSALKKINRFTEKVGNFSIPSFIIADNKSGYSLHELKNDIINYYLSKNITSEYEFEIMMVHNSGLLVKDWHKEDRSYIGLETGEDTMMWFFILMNEYLEIEREDVFDIRSYVRTEKTYNEF
jgi:hypothetical protein